MRKILLFLVVVTLLYLFFYRKEPRPETRSESISSESTAPKGTREDESTASSYMPTSDSRSGHQAGYEWAQEKGIDDEGSCEEAGERSNSPSFAEGCKDYVEENR
jgi:hypothetical protein